MSNLVYPANLPGLTFGNTRTPTFNTGVQQALSGKESRISYQIYPMFEFELQYELLRDYVTPSDLKSLVGLFIAVKGQWDTFLFSDPAFNTVAGMYMATLNGTTATYQTVAYYGVTASGAYGPEIIQNFNGTPIYAIQRYGYLSEYLTTGTREQFLFQSQTFTSPWVLNSSSLNVTGFAAPDGTSTTVSVQDTTTTNVYHGVAQYVPAANAAAVYTFSVFVLSSAVSGGAECDYIELKVVDTTTNNYIAAVFNIRTGVVVSQFTNSSGLLGPVSAIRASTGNWYRISLAYTKTNTNTVSIFIVPQQTASSETYVGTIGITSMFIWGAQYESSAISAEGTVLPTIYMPTTTATVTQYDYSVNATGIVTLNTPVAANANALLAWTGSFYYRVRFADDSMTVTQFLSNFWENKKVKLRQVKL